MNKKKILISILFCTLSTNLIISNNVNTSESFIEYIKKYYSTENFPLSNALSIIQNSNEFLAERGLQIWEKSESPKQDDIKRQNEKIINALEAIKLFLGISAGISLIYCLEMHFDATVKWWCNK